MGLLDLIEQGNSNLDTIGSDLFDQHEEEQEDNFQEVEEELEEEEDGDDVNADADQPGAEGAESEDGAEGEVEEGAESAEEEESEDDPDGIAEEDLPKWASKVRDAFPDRKFESLDDYDAAMDEYNDSLHTQIGDYKATVGIIDEVMTEVPELGQILIELKKGQPLALALLKAGVDAESLDPELYEEKTQEELIRAKIDLEARRKKNAEDQERINLNQRASEKAFNDWKLKNKLKDSEGDKVIHAVQTAYQDLLEGKITPEVLDLFHKGATHDATIQAAVQNAEDNGRIRGRNEKIKLEKKKKAGDGLPTLNSSAPKAKKVEKDPELQAMARAFSSQPRSFLDMLPKTKK